MQLRDYQTDAISRTLAAWCDHTDVLGIAATGAGKTQIFLSIVMRILDTDPAARVLIIAHRTELVEQPLERIRQMDADWLMRGCLERPRVGVIQAERNDTDRSLTIATVQSLTARSSESKKADRYPRIEQLLAAGPITHLITDESHHATADTYMALYQALKAATPALKHLGVTATPLRADGDGLAKVYQEVAFRITIADLVKRRYLVQPRWLGISTGISIKGVATNQGDYVGSQLATRFNTESGRRIIVDAYREYAMGRRAIAFTATVQAAHDLAASFQDAGFRAIAIDASTPKDQRRRVLQSFRQGDLDIISNCDVLSEGFDAPGTACVLMCRPTKSDSAYIQRMGRGLRPANGMALDGEDCLILDFLPAETRNIVMAGDVLGLPKETTRIVLEEEADAEPGEVQAGFTFDGERFDSDGTPLEIISRELRYLEASLWTWHRRDGLLTLSCGRGSDGIERILVIKDGRLWGIWRNGEQQADGHWMAVGRWVARPLPSDDPFARGEELASKHASQELVSKGRNWHKLPISAGQEAFLSGLARGALKRAEIRELSRGAASGLIAHFQAQQAIARCETTLISGVMEVV